MENKNPNTEPDTELLERNGVPDEQPVERPAVRAGVEPEDPPGMASKYMEAPFVYDAAESEDVALNSSALTYTVTDFVIPGRGGLNLNISRRCNSAQSSDKSFDYEDDKPILLPALR